MVEKNQFANRASISTVIFLLAAIAACSDSVDYESEEYDAGYSDGYAEGVDEAISCVKREGGSAEDAAENCDRRL